MNAWDRIAGNKPYPLAPDSSGSDAGDFRFPFSILCGIAGLLLSVAGLIAAFMGAGSLGLWLVGGGIVCALILWLLPPKAQRRPSK
jgi:hypothetical protein